MGSYRWMLGGLVGAVVGIVIWVLVGYFTLSEVGIIAWGIGLLVGLGIRFTAFQDGQGDSPGKGAFGAGLALIAILTAKYFLFLIFVSAGSAEREEIYALIDSTSFEEEAMIARIADDVVVETMGPDRSEEFFSNQDFTEPVGRDDYPLNIWRQAERRWRALGTDGQELERSELQSELDMMKSLFEPPSFLDFFSLFDILWFGLAAVTALRIGSDI